MHVGAAGNFSAPRHRCCSAESAIAGRHALASWCRTIYGAAAAAAASSAAVDTAADAADSTSSEAATAARYAQPAFLQPVLWSRIQKSVLVWMQTITAHVIFSLTVVQMKQADLRPACASNGLSHSRAVIP